MDLSKLRKANKIYQSLADKTIDEAMAELNTYDDIDHEVLHLIKSLITNSAESNTYFDQKIAQHYQNPINNHWHVGMVIDGYELTEVIGQGGMSMVFKAKRTDSATQKPVAIKIFNLTNQNPEIKAKFLAEQQILANLSHPNIINFHHGENNEQGDSYIVMELLDEGMTINEHVQKKQLKPRAIIELILQAANALQYAHSHLVIHRDIKPSNLMVTENIVLKVLDFGIAKLIDNKALADSPEDTILALTPSFAAPEQINADGVDITTDVYTLAAVTLSLLTNQQPFPADRMIKSCKNDEAHVNQLLNKHIDDQDLRNVLRKALKNNRQERYANMYAFSEDLQAWLAKKPVSATKDSWWYRLRRFAARRTALFATSIILAVTVIAAVAGLTHQNQAIKREAKKAEAVKNFMLNAFSVTDPNYAQGVDISSKDLLQVAAKKMATDDGMDADIKFELYLAMSLAHGRLGFYPEAIELLHSALILNPQNEQAIVLLAQYQFNAGQIEAVNALLEQTHENTFNSATNQAAIKRVRANLLAQAGNYDQAFEVFAELQNLPLSDTDHINNQALLAEIYYLKGESSRSIEIIEALQKSHPLPATDVLNLSLNSDLVQYHDRMGNFSAARALTEKNIQTYREILGDAHPQLGSAYNALSAFQRLDGQLEEALVSAKISKQIYSERFGASSEGLAQAHSNEGVALFYQNKHEPAIHELTTAANMLEEIFSSDHPETMNAKYNLATILNATGRPEQALPILQQNYQIESTSLGKNHRSALYTQLSLALTLANTGDFEQALNHAKQSIQIMSEQPSNHKHNINNAYSVLGRVHFMAGDFAQAITATLKSIEETTEANENNRARSLKLIAQSHQQLKSFDQADQYYRKWTEHLAKIYGETDTQHLEGLLEWAENSRTNEQAQQLIKQVQTIITEHDLNLPEIQEKLKVFTQNHH
jgi:tetratricopeptide (TPR) repeat protein